MFKMVKAAAGAEPAVLGAPEVVDDFDGDELELLVPLEPDDPEVLPDPPPLGGAGAEMV